MLVQPPKLVINQSQPIDWVCDHYGLETTEHVDVTILGADDSSVGIDVIRALHHQMTLKPTQLPHKLFIFLHADLITEAAQNALLKLLELDCDFVHWYFFLNAQKEHVLLPTLRSRLVSEHHEDTQAMDPALRSHYTSILNGEILCEESIDFDQWLLFLNEQLSLTQEPTKILRLIERSLQVRNHQAHHINWSPLSQMQMILTEL